MITCSECNEEWLFCWEIPDAKTAYGECEECVNMQETGKCDTCFYEGVW